MRNLRFKLKRCYEKSRNIGRSKSEKLQNEFEQFNVKCAANSELRKYWDGLVKLATFLKNTDGIHFVYDSYI